MTSGQQIMISLLFVGFMANLEQSRSRIPDASSVILSFSLTVTFFLKKLETELKNLLHNFHAFALSKGTIFALKC